MSKKMTGEHYVHRSTTIPLNKTEYYKQSVVDSLAVTGKLGYWKVEYQTNYIRYTRYWKISAYFMTYHIDQTSNSVITRMLFRVTGD